ncbi:uncharacterized protein TNCV_4171431 [Trichonephila clavipes]|nr:uncharacterized protein TNCV_4171431 [Trichonephila clavipes]
MNYWFAPLFLNGTIAISLFFVLSGFLNGYLISRDYFKNEGRISWLHIYQKRILSEREYAGGEERGDSRKTGPWVAQWLEHRTPDRKAWVRCPMPPNTLRVHMEYMLVKSVGPKVLWAEITSAGDWKIFPSPSVRCLNCGGEYRWCRHLSSLWEFLRVKSYCHLHGAQG